MSGKFIAVSGNFIATLAKFTAIFGNFGLLKMIPKMHKYSHEFLGR
jgi:hypothetical protein